VTTRGGAFEQVELSPIMTGVLADLEESVTRTAACITVDDLPAIRADRTQMRQLFQNLLVNAIKFGGTGAPAVRVCAEITADTVRIIVDDRGIGFAPEHAERIFNPFERLHARGEYEGTGIGLALCRRIMERHGGTIHAESRPDGGARFIAVFPALV
jgi:signal transduction histidine kinase